jgi:chromate transport protein ChrA
MGICEVIPGTSSSTMVVALATISRRSSCAGLIAQLIHIMPGAIILMILASLFKEYPTKNEQNILIFLAT